MLFHFIAIGGAVMHNLALELLAHGHHITGSDDEIFDPAKSRLKNAGILPEQYGWFPEKIHNQLDGIILGMHARADNPELIKAKELGLKIYSFPEYIYEHSKNKTRVVIGGSHGKTTSTAMLMHVLLQQNMDFDYLVGSQLSGFDRMVKLSDAPLIVIEGDEYLTSTLDPVPKFHRYAPQWAMITGVAWDHINVFPTFENYVKQFEIFVETINPTGHCFYYQSDVELEKLALKFPESMSPYAAPEFRASEKGTTVTVANQEFNLEIFGKHNLENAAGVQKLAEKLGISEIEFWTAMQSFGGTSKRLEKIWDTEELTIFKDFAHAPSKVKATVQAVRNQYPNHKMLALFELHTFSSLNPEFMPQYLHSLDVAEVSMVYYDKHVYELKKMTPVDTEFVKSAFGGDCLVFTEINELKSKLISEIENRQKPAVVLMMSSGNWSGLDVVEALNFSKTEQLPSST